jgi:hypothetical protein
LRDEALSPPAADEAPAARPDPGEVALAFHRLGRAVRLTLAMEARIRQEQADREEARRRAAPLGPAPAAAEGFLTTRVERRRNVLANMVPDMIEAQAEREFLPREKELYAEAEHLIEHELDDADVLERPMVELIGAVCKALGVEPDWSLWDPTDWTDKDHGLTEDEIAAGCPAPKPRRQLFPPPDPQAAEDTALRLAVAASGQAP